MFFWHFLFFFFCFVSFCSFINLDLAFVFFSILLSFLSSLHFTSSFFLFYFSFSPCFYLSPSVDGLWPFYFSLSIIFLFASSYFFLRLGYIDRLKKENRGDFFFLFKIRCNIMVRECENYFSNRSFVLPRNEGNEICLVYSKNIDLSLCKNSFFLF